MRLLKQLSSKAPAIEDKAEPIRSEAPPVKVVMPALSAEQLIRRACEYEQMNRDLGISSGPGRLYAPGESASVDAAITLLRIQTSSSTTWWDLVKAFLDKGSTASAKIALEHTAKAEPKKRQVPQVPRKSLWSRLKSWRAIAASPT